MLSETAGRILGLIAEGRSYDQILQQHPELTYFDIFAAAREALELAQAAPSGPIPDERPRADELPPPSPTRDVIPISEDALLPGPTVDEPPTVEPAPLPDAVPRRLSFVERARATHGRAFARWSREEDARLEVLFRDGTPRSEIARQLDRHDGAIVRRLEKLGLIETPERPAPRARRGVRPSRPSPVETRPGDEPTSDRSSVPGWELFRDRLSDDADVT